MVCRKRQESSVGLQCISVTSPTTGEIENTTSDARHSLISVDFRGFPWISVDFSDRLLAYSAFPVSSGASATCDADLFKADGTACQEGGIGAQCYGGSCKGLDAQCSFAFDGWQGTWSAHRTTAGMGVTCENGCGILMCNDVTQAPPPPGYIAMCISKSADFIQDYAFPPTMVATGTPCGLGDGTIGICQGGQCGAPPPTVAPTPPPAPPPAAPNVPPPPPPTPPPPAPPPVVTCAGTWSAYSTCSLSCGGGTQSRSFTETTPASNGGQACPVSPATRSCNADACPPAASPPPPVVNCVGAFGPDGPCSATCGGGVITRTYAVTTPASGGGTECAQDTGDTETDATPCNTAACVALDP